MVLYIDWGIAMGLDIVFGNTNIFNRPTYLYIVLNQYAILDNGYTRRGKIGTISIKPGSRIYNIVNLPFSRGFANIHKRCVLFIHAGTLSVFIGPVMVVIQYLYFIQTLKQYTAVSPLLAFPNYF
jgi:hypothetical protein